MPKGLYEGVLTVSAGKENLAQGRFHLRVFGFELPRESHLPTAFQFSFERRWSKFGEYYPDLNLRLFTRVWESMAQHRVSPMHLGGGPPRPAEGKALQDFDRYVDLARRLGFNRFLPFHWGPPVDTDEDRQWVRQMTDYYATKGVLDRTFVYMCQFDEAGPDRWPAAAKYAQALKAAEPRLLRFLTVGPAEPLYGAVDVWCPRLWQYDRQRAEERRKQGEKVWWYTCWNVPSFPCLLLDEPAVDHRALFWLTWTHGAEGLLYWCINFWQQNPWDNPQMGSGTFGNGDGYFLYPRRPDDPPERFYESTRWEMIREGLEDYETFWLLRKQLATAEAGGQAKPAALARARTAFQLVEKVAGNLHDFSRSPEDYAHVKRQVAEAIEALNTPQAGDRSN